MMTLAEIRTLWRQYQRGQRQHKCPLEESESLPDEQYDFPTCAVCHHSVMARHKLENAMPQIVERYLFAHDTNQRMLRVSVEKFNKEREAEREAKKRLRDVVRKIRSVRTDEAADIYVEELIESLFGPQRKRRNGNANARG